MKIPILDVFILSLLDRGAESAYDFLRDAGISLGASTPALLRLTKGKLVVRKKSPSSGRRTRYAIELTPAGVKAARTAWKESLSEKSRIFDLDSTLRVVDMAIHYRASRQAIRTFLRHAGGERLRLSDETAMKLQNAGSNTKLFSTLKARCEADRLRSEADILIRASDSFKQVREPVEGQRALL